MNPPDDSLKLRGGLKVIRDELRNGVITGPITGSVVLHTSSGTWQPTEFPGFYVKPIYEDAVAGERTLLMKIEAGARADAHEHPTQFEQIYVLSGTFVDGSRTLAAGDYCCRAPGARHEGGSDPGAMVLVFYSRR